jgi:hypothetical protein
VLERLYPTGEGTAAYNEVAAAASEWQEEGTQVQGTNFRDILATKEKRMALTAGVGIQVKFSLLYLFLESSQFCLSISANFRMFTSARHNQPFPEILVQQMNYRNLKSWALLCLC